MSMIESLFWKQNHKIKMQSHLKAAANNIVFWNQYISDTAAFMSVQEMIQHCPLQSLSTQKHMQGCVTFVSVTPTQSSNRVRNNTHTLCYSI